MDGRYVFRERRDGWYALRWEEKELKKRASRRERKRVLKRTNIDRGYLKYRLLHTEGNRIRWVQLCTQVGTPDCKDSLALYFI